ncbi:MULTISPECIES: MFS transporter [unclassified Nocardioides]|uniref:MFS transporter n=1 Tax=unclassified Nocardioides TaxID=2615069 RepID=UPI0006F41604|nr:MULTISPECIES: MFS transporter [unclassified Nocardioides]
MSAAVPTVRERALVPTLVLIASSTAVVASLGAPLVPMIARDEGVSLSNAQWILTVTFLTGAVTSPIIGRLGGGRHRRPVILAGLLAVCLGSVLAALPLGFGAMVFGRVLQGVGLSLTPLAIAVARELVAEEKQLATLATLSITTVAGAGMGYPLASYIVQEYGVSAAYWVGAAMAALTLAAAVLAIPANRGSEPRPLDLVGAVLLGGGAGGLLLGVSQAHHWSGPLTIGIALASLAMLAAWVRWTLARRDPLVDLRLATRHGVLGANVTALLAGCGMYMLITMVVLIVQAPTATGYGLGHSLTVAGLMLVPFSFANVLGNRILRALDRRVAPDMLLPIGSCLFLVATLVLAGFRDTLWGCVLAMVIGGLGAGASFAAMPRLIVRFTPAGETGSVMAFNQILRYLGFSAGSALVLAVLQLYAGPDGALTATGFTVAALAASAVSGVAAVLGFVLARSVTDPEPTLQEVR